MKRTRRDARTERFLQQFDRVYARFLKLDARRQRQFLARFIALAEPETDSGLRELYEYLIESFKEGMKDEGEA